MNERKTYTFLEALDRMVSTPSIELRNPLIARGDVRALVQFVQQVVWRIATDKEPELRRQSYLHLVAMNRDLDLPTPGPEIMLGSDAVADGYTMPEGGET